MKVDVWEDSPFYMLSLNHPSVGTPIKNVFGYINM